MGRSRTRHPFGRESRYFVRRAFQLEDERAPFASADMIAFVETFGAPHILVVLGLGVAPALLQRCGNSVIIYNSIDAPSLRVPEAVSAHFDLVLTGAQWQSDEVHARHPDVFDAALRKLGVSAEDAVVIGDTPYDAVAAARAGIDAIGVLSGGFAETDLRRAGCGAIYPGPAALLACFDQSPLAATHR